MSSVGRDDFPQLDAWLDRLLDASPEERTQILVACADPTLRDRLCTLLATELQSGPLDATPLTLARTVLEAGTARAADARRGARMGAYRIANLLGEGGSATVWLGTRDDGAITHEVAVKCLKSGLATPEQRTRFVREQQILARLAHPNIARLFDVGINDDGVPYIVMERIDGQPLTRWCDLHELSIDARIELFRSVLHAVAYAHQNLIVHRDLKPGNIIVGADAAPKLLDFGIAKLLDGSEEATQTQARALTPGYAAPEQFSGDPITTATDVYALGIVLYELLTGARPLRENPAQELAAPSQYVQQWRRKLGDASGHPADLAARCRGYADSAQLARVLRGDLDALVLAATAPDSAQRYATIAAFDADVERFLQHRPLQARRTSRSYRLRKYAARHWVAIGAAAAVICALLIGSGIALWQAGEARRSAEHANAVQNFLLSIFETARPGPRADSLLTNRELVEHSAQQLQAQMSREPQTDAPLRLALGRVYRKMGLLDQALPLLADAVATMRKSGDNTKLAEALEAHAHALTDALQYKSAVDEFNESLGLRRAAHAAPMLEAATLSGLGEAQSHGGDHDAAIASLHGALDRLDAAADADPELRQRVLASLAAALRTAGKPDNAIAIAEQAVTAARQSFGARTREEASALSVLGSVQRHSGRLRDAADSLKATVSIDLDFYHQPVPAHLYNLGLVLRDLGDYAGAEQNLRDALAAQIAELGADHPAVGNYQKELGLALHALGREAEAETVLRSALAHSERGYDAQSPEVADKRVALADVLLARGEVSPARKAYQQVIETASMPGAGRLRLRALALAGLARDDAAVNDFAHAAQLAQEALAAAQLNGALEPQEHITLELDLGEALLAAGKGDDAAYLFRKSELRCLTILPDAHPLRARALFDQARVAQARGESAHARKLLDSALASLRERLPPQHPLLLAALAFHDNLDPVKAAAK